MRPQFQEMYRNFHFNDIYMSINLHTVLKFFSFFLIIFVRKNEELQVVCDGIMLNSETKQIVDLGNEKTKEENKLLNNYRNSKEVRRLLAEGVNPLCSNKNGYTVVHHLCNDKNKTYDRQLCKEICEKNPDIKLMRNKDGYTPYDLAKARKKYDLLYITGLYFSIYFFFIY